MAPEEEEDGPVLLFLRRLMAAPRALLNSLAPLAADDGEYVSTSLSMGTLLSVVLFVFVAAFSLI